jgi:hypothetical protein
MAIPMTQYGWADCPEPIRAQINNIVHDLQHILDETLIGVYLHGSLAMNCFNPALSDIDLLAVVSASMAVETKRHVAESLLRYSCAPHPVEISILSESNLYPWEYPTPFEFHYSEAWRERHTQDLASGAWRDWNARSVWDTDLAGHITIAHFRGVRLFGEPVGLVLPLVPATDYADSIVTDLWEARDRALEDPARHGVYFVLNACRVYAYLLDGLVASKDEGAQWALTILPAQLRPSVEHALGVYRGDIPPSAIEPATLYSFMTHIEEQVRVFVS